MSTDQYSAPGNLSWHRSRQSVWRYGKSGLHAASAGNTCSSGARLKADVRGITPGGNSLSSVACLQVLARAKVPLGSL